MGTVLNEDEPDTNPDLGGKVNISQILGAVGAGSGALAGLAPITAPITLPISILSGLGSSIASIFGAGGLTQKELNMADKILSDKMFMDNLVMLGHINSRSRSRI